MCNSTVGGGHQEVGGFEVEQVVHHGKVEGMNGAAHPKGFATIGKEVINVLDLKSGNHQAGAAQSDFLHHRFVFNTADKGFGCAEAVQFAGVGIDCEDRLPSGGEGGCDGASHRVHADYNAMPAAGILCLGEGLLFTAEEAKDAALFAHPVKCVRVEDEVGRDRDCDEPHHPAEGDEGPAYESGTGTECEEDEGEFTDLPGGDGGMEGGVSIKAHPGEDCKYEEWFYEEHENAEGERRDPDGSEVLHFHADAEGHEKDRDEESHEGVEAAMQVFVHRQLRHCDAGEEGSDFEGEMELVSEEDDKEAPAKRPDKDGIGGVGGPCKGAGQEVTRCRKHHQEE